jgi:hypothetical protein
VIILPKKEKREFKKDSGLIRMKSIAPSPQHIPGVGEVPVNGEFEVPESKAKELERGLYKRVKGGKG